MRRSRRVPALLAAVVIGAGMLSGCGSAQPAPHDLCDVIGAALIGQLVPAGDRKATDDTPEIENSNVSCEATTEHGRDPGGQLLAYLTRFSPCYDMGGGESECSTRTSRARYAYDRTCERWRNGSVKAGAPVKVPQIGQRTCAFGKYDEATAEAYGYLAVQDGGDFIEVQYRAKPSTVGLAMGAARAVAGNVLAGL